MTPAEEALQVLGLTADTDARAIKRAYATRLRTTRPDADPEGFQALNAAYQAALVWVASKDEDVADDDPADATMQGTTAPSDDTDQTSAAASALEVAALEAAAMASARLESIPLEPATAEAAAVHTCDDPPVDTLHFDVDDFLEQCATRALRCRDGELLAWLNAEPILWSLQHKAQIGEWLLQSLYQQRPPIEARRFDVLAGFFGLLELNSGYDAYLIQRLRHRLHLAWEIQTEQLRALSVRSNADGGSTAGDIRQTRRILKQLQRPLHLPQALLAGLVPMYPSAIRRFLHRLDFGHLDDLPSPIDPDQVAFWDAAADRSRFGKPRWALLTTRWLVYALGITLALVLSVLLSEQQTVGGVGLAMVWPQIAVASFGGLLLLWVAHVAHLALRAWLALPDSAASRHQWLRMTALPVLGAATLTADRLLGLDIIGVALSMYVFVLAAHRYRRRSGEIFGYNFEPGIRHIPAALILVSVTSAVSDSALGFLTLGIVGIALTLWAIDLRKQRAASQT